MDGEDKVKGRRVDLEEGSKSQTFFMGSGNGPR